MQANFGHKLCLKNCGTTSQEPHFNSKGTNLFTCLFFYIIFFVSRKLTFPYMHFSPSNSFPPEKSEWQYSLYARMQSNILYAHVHTKYFVCTCACKVLLCMHMCIQSVILFAHVHTNRNFLCTCAYKVKFCMPACK